MLATESWEHHGKRPQKVKRVAETRLSESLCTAKKPPMRNAGISADAVGHTLLRARFALRQLPRPPGWSCAGSSGRGTPGLGCTPTPTPDKEKCPDGGPVRDRLGQSSWRWEGRALVQGKELRKVMAKPPGTSVGRRLCVCVSERSCQAGQQGRGRGGPVSPQGLAKGRGPEDPRPAPEAEGLGRAALYDALLKAGGQPRPGAGAPRPGGCSHSRGAPWLHKGRPPSKPPEPLLGWGPVSSSRAWEEAPTPGLCSPAQLGFPPPLWGCCRLLHIRTHHMLKSCSWVSSTSKTFPSVKRKAFRRMGAAHRGRTAVLVPAAPGAPGLGAPGLAQTLQPHSGLPWWLRH